MKTRLQKNCSFQIHCVRRPHCAELKTVLSVSDHGLGTNERMFELFIESLTRFEALNGQSLDVHCINASLMSTPGVVVIARRVTHA